MKNTETNKGRGPQRTTREDWINTALDTLISEGVDSVKVLALSEKLGCARSSFYWYFKNRAQLLDSLLDHWQSINTRSIINKANMDAPNINAALINVFKCWVDESLFDTSLDFAVREWARRSGTVRRALDLSDSYALEALTNMFERYDYPPSEAAVRAKIVYFTQIGYNTLDAQDPIEVRMNSGPDYIYCMTGQKLSESELAAAMKNVAN